MKKLLLFGTLALFGLVSGQTKFGVKAGYALSSLSLKQDNQAAKLTTDSKSTFYLGGLVEHRLKENLALQGELLYSSLGGKVSDSEYGGYYYLNYTENVTLGTLLIPVSLKYYANSSLALSGGLNFGFIVSATKKTTFNHNLPAEALPYLPSNDEEKNIKSSVNTFNFGPFLGAEYTLKNGLFFDTRYNFGVTNLSKESGGKVYNNFWQIGLGYKFK